MTEPASSTIGGIAAYKLAVAFGLPAGLAAIVVMCAIQPKSPREWPVAIITTVVSSVCGGAAFAQHFGLTAWADTYIGLVALAGIIFACGLPGWVLVRAAFLWAEKRKGKDIAEMLADAKGGQP